MRFSTVKRVGLIAVGILLISWGTTSAFADFGRLNLQLNPIDNPDSNGSQVYYPSAAPVVRSRTPFAPMIASPSPAATMDAGEAQAFSAPYTPGAGPSATPQAAGMAPDRIEIPAINLDAPITKVGFRLVTEDTNSVFQQWLVPNDFVAGWLASSALLGVPGNTVLDGHHNEYGEVFGKLVNLHPGDAIFVDSGNVRFHYVVANKMILPERNQPLSVRFANAQWIMPSQDERLTLVTCWPHTSNTHRLIIVASPDGKSLVNPE